MTWRPLRDEFGEPPRPLTESLDRITRSFGAPSPAALDAIFNKWKDIVGPSVAAHSRPLSLHRGTLTIAVDQPGWATQLTYLEADLKRRIAAEAGPGAVSRVRVTVRPK